MEQQQQQASLAALKDIRSIMERNSRFISLSGWSGIWAGCVALVAAAIARPYVHLWQMHVAYRDVWPTAISLERVYSLLLLAGITLLVAAAGAFYFTYRKSRTEERNIWGAASRKLFIALLIPLLAGGAFCCAFLANGDFGYVAPACLAFYGMALVNGGKYTLGEIRYLGYSELLLGCICLFFPGYGLYFWAAGFGVMHIIYGIIMWNRYDKQEKKAA